MNRSVHAFGAVIGALVLVVVGCTPPPGPSGVDRINFWTIDGTSIHTNLVIEPGTPPPSGLVENTSTASTVELTTEVAVRLASAP